MQVVLEEVLTGTACFPRQQSGRQGRGWQVLAIQIGNLPLPLSSGATRIMAASLSRPSVAEYRNDQLRTDTFPQLLS